MMIELNRDSFAERLAAARKAKGYRQSDLAEITQLTAQTLSAYEKRSSSNAPSLEGAYKLACALDVPLDWLCGRDGVETPNLMQKSIYKTGDRLALLNGLCFDLEAELDPKALNSGKAILTFGPVVAKFFKDMFAVKKLADDGVIDQEQYDMFLKGLYRKFDEISFEEARKHPKEEA